MTAVCGFEWQGHTNRIDGRSPRQHRVLVAADVVSYFSVPTKNWTFPGAAAMATSGHYSSGQCYGIHMDIKVSVGFGFAIQRRTPFENESFVGPPCGSRLRRPRSFETIALFIDFRTGRPRGPVLSAFFAIFSGKNPLKSSFFRSIIPGFPHFNNKD